MIEINKKPIGLEFILRGDLECDIMHCCIENAIGAFYIFLILFCTVPPNFEGVHENDSLLTYSLCKLSHLKCAFNLLDNRGAWW